MNTTQLMLIDLSGLAHQLYHVSGNEPDPSWISNQLIARVRALASEHPHAAICCDAGTSFRKDIDPAYKAQRDTENRAVIKHQIAVACDTLKADGFPIWSVQGFEADDLIATATREALAIEDTTVLVVSADKDLLQLVSDRVTQHRPDTGARLGPDEVMAKFKVKPSQMLDYLALVGDASDNIKGASNIGPKTAAELIEKFGDVSSVFKAIFAKIPYAEAKDIYARYAKAGEPEWKRIKKDLETRVPVTPSVFLSLVEFYPRWPTVRQLIALRADVPIPFAEIAVEREAKPMVEAVEMENEGYLQSKSPGEVDVAEFVSAGKSKLESMVNEDRELNQNESLAALGAATANVAERINAQPHKVNTPEQDALNSHLKERRERERNDPAQAMKGTPERGDVDGPTRPVQMAPYVAGPPLDFSQQLEPRNMQEAVVLAQRMFESRLFSAYGTPQAVLAVILTGREHGMPAMASLRGHHIIEGKATQSADTIAGIVLASKKAKYFKPTKRTATEAAFKTLRVGEDEEPFELTYTIDEAKLAWKKDQKAWDNSGWGKNPTDMLVARAKAKLARLIYPDVVGGMYAPEELD